MPGLSYAAPTSVDDAVKLLAGASGVAKLLSGGTDLLVQLRSGRVQPELIVDTKKIPGIIGIREENGGFVIGAATPGAVVEAHHGLNATWPGLVEALDLIGSTQVQGRCSLAGNLCNASPAADSVPALFAAAAIAVVVGPATAGAKCRSSGSRRARPHLAGEGRVHPGIPPAAASGPVGRRLSALHSAHGNGYRGRRLRHQRDPGCERGLHRRRASPWARWRRRCCWCEAAADALIGAHARRRHAGEAGRGGPGRGQADQRQARQRSNTAPRSPACWPAAPPRSPLTARRQS